MFKNIIKISINLILLISSFLILSILSFDGISRFFKIILLILEIIFFSFGFIFKYLNKPMLSRLFYVLYVALSIILIAYYFMYLLNLLYIFSSVDILKDYIISTEEKGVIVYILLQLLQVIFLPIPASVICVVGSLIYGPLLGGLYCTVGVLVGSYISYFLGRTFGYRLVSWVVGKDNADKYSEILRKRGGFFLIIAFLLPMFPDDILCLIAGISNMSFVKFFFITLIARPIGVICMAFFGSGAIIPFSGWGLYAWIGILVVAVILVYITYRWQNEIQTWVLNKIPSKKRKVKNKLN